MPFSAPKVLIVAPTARAKDYCFDDWVDMIHKINYPELEVLLVDNSEDDDYIQRIAERGINADRMKPQGSPVHYITACQEHLRKKSIDAEADFVLSLETDVFIEPNLLSILVAYNLPVISVPYLLKDGDETTLSFQASTIGLEFGALRNLSMRESAFIFDGQVKNINTPIGLGYEVEAAGVGCTLIRKDVLPRFEFRYEKERPTVFADTFFHVDINQQEIPNFLYMNQLCEHRRTGWDDKVIKLIK